MGSCAETESPASVVTHGPVGRIKKQAGITSMTMISEQEPGTKMGEGSLKINSTQFSGFPRENPLLRFIVEQRGNLDSQTIRQNYDSKEHMIQL